MTNDLLFQLDAAAQRVKGRDHTMIDPVEFSEIKGAVAALQAQVADFKVRQARMDKKLDMVLDKLAGRVLRPRVDALFRPLERDHCRESFESEQRRAHLPAAYRDSP